MIFFSRSVFLVFIFFFRAFKAVYLTLCLPWVYSKSILCFGNRLANSCGGPIMTLSNNVRIALLPVSKKAMTLIVFFWRMFVLFLKEYMA